MWRVNTYVLNTDEISPIIKLRMFNIKTLNLIEFNLVVFKITAFKCQFLSGHP